MRSAIELQLGILLEQKREISIKIKLSLSPRVYVYMCLSTMVQHDSIYLSSKHHILCKHCKEAGQMRTMKSVWICYHVRDAFLNRYPPFLCHVTHWLAIAICLSSFLMYTQAWVSHKHLKTHFDGFVNMRKRLLFNPLQPIYVHRFIPTLFVCISHNRKRAWNWKDSVHVGLWYALYASMCCNWTATT